MFKYKLLFTFQITEHYKTLKIVFKSYGYGHLLKSKTLTILYYYVIESLVSTLTIYLSFN